MQFRMKIGLLLTLFWVFGSVDAGFASDTIAYPDSLYHALLGQEGTLYDKEKKKVYHREVKKQIQYYQKRVAENLGDAEAHYRLARLYMILNTVGSRQRAKNALEDAIRLNPERVDYHLTLGKLLLAQMFWYNGNAHYEKLVEQFPDDKKALAKAQYWMGFYAMQGFLAYKDRLIMGNEEFASEDRLKALELFKKSIAADPAFQDPYYHLGLVFLEGDQPDSLIVYARQLVHRYPDDANALLFCGLGYQTKGDEEQAYEFYTSALNVMSEEDREMIESLEYVATEDEYKVWKHDGVTDAERFWRGKDPLFLTSFNESRMDHYRRVAYANLRFSRLMRGIPGWQTDQGKTHIRFGPYVSRTVYERRETWYYGDFRIHFRSGADLDAWYFDGEDLNEALASMDAGYWPDHGRVHFKKQPPNFHDPYHNEKYSLPYQVAAFAEKDSVRLEVGYAIPVAKVNFTYDSQVENGVFLFDAQWDSVYRHVEKQGVFDLNTHQNPDGLYWILQHTVVVPADSYQVIAEVADFEYGSVGTFRLGKSVFLGDSSLSISDPLLASNIQALRPDPYSRADIKLIHNPLRTFRQSEFLHLYFEVYHLQRNAFGRTHYDVSYRVGWPKEEEIASSLFMAVDQPDAQMLINESDLAPEGFRDYQVRYVLPEQPHLVQKRGAGGTETEVTVNYEGNRTQEVIFLNIDLSQVPIGIHELQVTVQQAGEKISRQVLFRVVD